MNDPGDTCSIGAGAMRLEQPVTSAWVICPSWSKSRGSPTPEGAEAEGGPDEGDIGLIDNAIGVGITDLRRSDECIREARGEAIGGFHTGNEIAGGVGDELR